MKEDILMKRTISILCISILFISSSYGSTEEDVVRLFSSTAFEKIKSEELSDNFVFSSIEFLEKRDDCSTGTCIRTRTFEIAYDNVSVADSACNLIIEFAYDGNEKQIEIKKLNKNCK